MKPTSWNSIPTVFFPFALMGKLEKTRFERNLRPSSTRVFALSSNAHPKWWYETDLVEFDPKGVFSFCTNGESRKNAIRGPSSTSVFALLRKAHPKWWYETDLVEFDPKGFFSCRPDGESRKNLFSMQLDDLPQQGFFRYLEKPTQNGGMKPTSCDSIPRVLFRFAPIGKVEKTRFEHCWTSFVNPAFCAAWKSPPKLVV